MPEKLGKGGNGPQDYDPQTGKYGSDSGTAVAPHIPGGDVLSLNRDAIQAGPAGPFLDGAAPSGSAPFNLADWEIPDDTDFEASGIDPETGLRKNPDYDKDNPEKGFEYINSTRHWKGYAWDHNCQRVAICFELHCRGYKVQAGERKRFDDIFDKITQSSDPEVQKWRDEAEDKQRELGLLPDGEDEGLRISLQNEIDSLHKKIDDKLQLHPEIHDIKVEKYLTCFYGVGNDVAKAQTNYARGVSGNGYGNSRYFLSYGINDRDYRSRFKSVIDFVLKGGPGSRYLIDGMSSFSGHIWNMIYKPNGEIHLIDAQTGTDLYCHNANYPENAQPLEVTPGRDNALSDYMRYFFQMSMDRVDDKEINQRNLANVLEEYH